MELEVGQFVRTNGKIYKIGELGYNNETFMSDKEEGWYKVEKSSPNIIDLIEVGDYVNGYKVDFVQNNEVIFNHNHPRQLNIFAKDIKSIVTKEQFKAMEYIVGGSYE